MNDDPEAPASAAGLTHLASIIADRFAGARVAVDGVAADAVVEALAAVGVAAERRDVAAEPIDVVVSLGDRTAPSAPEAGERVQRLTDGGVAAVVFADTGGTWRFPAWWDQVFDSVGFDAHDVLRTELWDDDEWDGEALSGLTLYRRRRSSASEDAPPTTPIPRSAVHPGAFVAAHRVATGVRRLAEQVRPGRLIVDPLQAISRTLDERAARAEQDRADLEGHVAEARDAADAARADAAAAALDAAAEAVRREEQEAARHRAEAEIELVRAERDAIVDAAVVPAGHPPTPVAAFRERATAAIGRRARRRAVALAERASATAPGVVGRAARRSLTVYTSMTHDWREATREVFDTDFYLDQEPGLVGSGVDPVVHYSQLGWRLGLDPHPLFDTDWYRRRHVAVLPADVSPLEHYLSVGWRQGCDPHPLFDTDFYLRRSKDVAVANVNPLVHYLSVGWRQGRDPHPLFETNRYLDLAPDVRHHDVCPLVHYVLDGWEEGRSPGELFDGVWYAERYPESVRSGMPPYRYYLEIGVRRGDLPSPWAERLSGLDDGDAVGSDGVLV